MLCGLGLVDHVPGGVVRDDSGGHRRTAQHVRGHLGRDLVIVGQAMNGRHLLSGCLRAVRALPDVLLGQVRRPAPYLHPFVQRRGVDRLEPLGIVHDPGEDVVNLVGDAAHRWPAGHRCAANR
ncbi:hypothetical protein AQJ58_20305 [Streptomyces sp. DSM 15324]|nr:hypothetical protein AQJ58_20305 [Streptomyces sp. DSM 15324]